MWGKEREVWEIIVFCWYKMMELKNISYFTGIENVENGKRLRPKWNDLNCGFYLLWQMRGRNSLCWYYFLLFFCIKNKRVEKLNSSSLSITVNYFYYEERHNRQLLGFKYFLASADRVKIKIFWLPCILQNLLLCEKKSSIMY